MENIGILKINETAEKIKGVVRFDKGSGKFPFPEEFLPLLDRVKKEIAGKYFHYPATGGEGTLRLAVADWELKGGRKVSPENVVITNGGMSGLFTFFSLVTRPGDEIITNRYSFEGFTNLADYFRLKQRRVDLSDVYALSKVVTARTKAVVYNSPENPTGKVYSAEETANLVRFTKKYKLWLLSDEVTNQIIYRRVRWVGPDLTEKHVVAVSSFSKNWFLSGIRTGWLASGNKHFIEDAANLLSVQSIGVSLWSQLLMTEILKEINYQAFQKKYIVLLGKRRDLVRERLKDKGLGYLREVEGGMNYYVDLGSDSAKLATGLLKDKKVALIPGTLFEDRISTYVRLGFGAVDEKEIVKGIEKISKFLKRKQ